MSFRERLTLFFTLMVIVPMAAATIVVFELIDGGERSRRDARAEALQVPTVQIYRSALRDSDRVLGRVARDELLTGALVAGARSGAVERARQLVEDNGVRRLRVVAMDGRPIVDVGGRDAVFPASRTLRSDGRPVARLELSRRSARAYVADVERLTGEDVVVRRAGRVLAASLASPPDDVSGVVEIGGRDHSANSFAAPGFGGPRVTVTLLVDEGGTDAAAREARWIGGGLLLVFIALACWFAIAASRSLQRQIAGLLDAARRLGSGDFATKVPTVGNDEFAALGQEFNTMAEQLQERLEQLLRERDRVGRSIVRLGDAVASNLNRDGLLAIVVETAVESAGAEGGRATTKLADGSFDGRMPVGSLSGLEEALARAEDEVVATGAAAVAVDADVAAMAHPLRGVDDPDLFGVVSVARRGEPFAEADQDVFGYLASQAAISLTNVGLHEAVRRQAAFDALTGLFTRRRFDEALAAEVERARRYPDGGLSLVLLDIDDFKAINDTHGHQVGDEVLRQVARIVRETSRDTDAPSRYGGEELAVVLPNTDIEGAVEMAERVRSGIEQLSIAGSGGAAVRVTVSLGVAALGPGSADARELVRAADSALYEAKRTGKNRTARAE